MRKKEILNNKDLGQEQKEQDLVLQCQTPLLSGFLCARHQDIMSCFDLDDEQVQAHKVGLQSNL